MTILSPVRGAAASMFAAIMAAALLGGCALPKFSLPSLPSMPEPWVKPFERERLADPVMQVQRDAMSSRHFEHVRDVREGSRGATGVQGGGCGCN